MEGQGIDCQRYDRCKVREVTELDDTVSEICRFASEMGRKTEALCVKSFFTPSDIASLPS